MSETIRARFEEAFEAHADELFRHAALRLSNRDRALEITQECFLKALQYAQGGSPIHEIRPFLFRTLRNLIIDEYRKAKSYSLDAMLEDDEGGLVESALPQDETNTLEAALTRFDARRALEALQNLPDLYRETLAFRYVDGLSPSEIAQRIGESENVVSVRIHRGLKKLRETLEQHI